MLLFVSAFANEDRKNYVPKASTSSFATSVPSVSCDAPRSDPVWGLSEIRGGAFWTVCAVAREVNSWFGETDYSDGLDTVGGLVFFDYEGRERTRPAFKTHMRAHARLPNLERKYRVSIEAEGERLPNEIPSAEERSSQAAAPPSPYKTGQKTSGSLAIKMSLYRREGEYLEAKLGARRTGMTVWPYPRLRYVREFGMQSTSRWTFSEMIFWRPVELYGQTTTLDFNYTPVGYYRYLWFNNATVSQVVEVVRWQTGVTVTRLMGPLATMALTLSMTGDTGANVGADNYGWRLAWRQGLGRKWLIGEVYAGVDYPHVEPESRFNQSFAGFRLEVWFGH